ncbi:sigma 54-interacting transcriptional regulator [Rhodoplanes sp. TEM]|uniref:sigma-54-dependent Fis family transcriptional regulator n=1 Tax=Rhodoplanes tepidamans TaxID=200616 RepID=UPI00255D965F|nr:sigma 54-interacting transcriptional regulator [Rhodoplanes tepidamans]MDC7986753.1 sigma 54-interacting transcriptional regulator [Rhodoplanes sp. TEM]MDQ0353464.1 transcriptional regulator of acetoin/glycerol metabolism [Rhodoplanes tepidamans]
MTGRSARDPQTVLKARQRFLVEGVVPARGIPGSIGRSWVRCAALGLKMDFLPRFEPLSYREFRDVHSRNDELVRAARVEMDALDDDARMTGAIVILTDPTGIVLSRTGNVEFAELASRVALRPGIPWSEENVGTNAIGTAIAERQEVRVVGAEHFFDVHRVLSCSAVPIFGPTGDIVGVLDLTNASEIPQTHTLALVRRAAEQIESHLFNDRFRDHEQVHFHCDPGLMGTLHEGRLAFEDDRVVGANRRALRLLGLDWSDLGAKRFGDLFDVARGHIMRARSPEGTRFATTEGRTLFGRLHPQRRPKLTLRVSSDRELLLAQAMPVFDEATLKSLGRATRLADAGLSILVQGETGTGKEMFARRLHAASRRREGPFVVADCAVTDGTALAAALFGDAEDPDRVAADGALRRAEGGVLLLDEIDAMPVGLQERLVRLLRHRGAGRDPNVEAPFDLALVSATRRRLGDLVSAGAFRQDLFALLAGYTVDLPSLRDDPGRAALIAEAWEQIASPGETHRLTPEILAALTAYQWPGNHRQLVGTLRALAVLAAAGEVIEVATLPQEMREARAEPRPETPPWPEQAAGLDSITLTAMRAALAAEQGNISRAARRLGIHRSTLYRRLFGPGRHTAAPDGDQNPAG